MEAPRTFSESVPRKSPTDVAGPFRNSDTWWQAPLFLSGSVLFPNSLFCGSLVAESRPSAYLITMANGLMPRVGLCALYFLSVGCSSNQDADVSSVAGAPPRGGAAHSGGGDLGALASAGSVSHGGLASAGEAASGGQSDFAGSAGKSASGGPPPAVDGLSVYTLECHGDSKDCNLATVPCFGVSSPMPNVAAGWACANRCVSNADCSDAASGAEAHASCVSFSSASHCVLVCQNENQSFTCPDGMTCYTPQKSPISYCLWQ